MLAGKSGEEKTIWCFRLWRVILLELNMLTLTMRDWTSQINRMRGVGFGMPHSRLMIPESQWDVLTFYSLSMASRWVGCVRYWGENGCDYCGYMWVCPYWCMWVRMGSGSRSFAVRHHMFVQSEQGCYEYCWIWCRLTKVWMARWWRVWCRSQQCANFCVWWLWVVCPCLRKGL